MDVGKRKERGCERRGKREKEKSEEKKKKRRWLIQWNI
jgi:hypothetical protein